ncbi:MAG: cysteine--tRNA ligase [Candidatus Nanopelagicaceae bacterium]
MERDPFLTYSKAITVAGLGASFSHNLPLVTDQGATSSHASRLSALIGQRVSIRLREEAGGFRDLLGILRSPTEVERKDGSIATFNPNQVFAFRHVLPRTTKANATGVQIYDTLSRKLSEIHSSDGRSIRIYCCGPTVYRDAHLGNLRTFLLADIVRRALEFSGHNVRLIQNITDVGHMSEDFDEDKMLKESKETSRDPFEIAREFESKFHKDLARLGVIPADHYPRASECIEMMQSHIKELFDLDLAYQGDDKSVYFSSERFPSYGALSGNRLTDLKPGHRYEFTEAGAKRFHADWALWKSAGNRTQMIWDSPWGAGFPGWHIECSAMSLHYLDGHVDLHIGGIDLRFPHHENERAQSNPLTKDQEAVDLWLHGEHLLFEGRKMSKSAGNVVLLEDVIARGLDPLAVRFCFLENRYRSQMDLSWASITAADKLLTRWRSKYASPTADSSNTEITQSIINEVFTAVATDLDTPRALQRLRTLEKDDSIDDATKANVFQLLDPLFGLDFTKIPTAETKDLSPEDSSLLDERQAARNRKDFAESDRLRDLLAEHGIEVRDTASGQEWGWL